MLIHVIAPVSFANPAEDIVIFSDLGAMRRKRSILLKKTLNQVPPFVEAPVDGVADGAAWGVLDPSLGAETLGDVSAQVVDVVGRVGDRMADALQTFDQTARLGAIAPRAGVMANRIGRPGASTAA